MPFLKSLLQVSLAAAVGAGLAGCMADLDGSTGAAPADEDDPASARDATWDSIRAARQNAVDGYLKDHAAEFEAFLHRPLGKTGTPTALLRNFPAVFPDIWGAPAEHFGPIGFSADSFKPGATLPLGLGASVLSNGLEVATLTCAGCHVGGVIGPDGQEIKLIGAPNTGFNQFRVAINDTVVDPRYFAAFGQNALTVGFRDKVLQFKQLIDSTAGAFTYNPLRIPNAPALNTRDKPGFLDAIGIAVSILTLPELLDPATAQQIVVAVMPPVPAQVDIMSIWRQRERPLAQWDGSIASAIYRNLGAEVGVTADPAVTDYENAALTATFAQDLPPPPYPFDVDMPKARAGKQLHDQYCGGCHDAGSTTIFPVSATRTDPNRSLTITTENRRRLIAAVRSACKDPAVCDIPDDDVIRDVDSSGRGYMALPLDGIWARAPYLHNGSVPTLYHLLVPQSRPATFFRGSKRFDQQKVGFVWDSSAASDPYTHVFDTGESGGANTGHDNAAFNGIDWSQHPEELAELLEYLKTL